MDIVVFQRIILKGVFYFLFFILSACEKSVQVPVPYNNINLYQDAKNSPLASPHTANSVVLITNQNGSLGTGFFVSKDGVLVTNDHVLGSTNCLKEGCFINLTRDYQKGSVAKDDVVFAHPLHVDKVLDASIFQIFQTLRNSQTGVIEKTEQKFSNQNYLKISNQEPQDFLDQEVFTIGHPLGALKKVTPLKILDSTLHNFKVAGALISGQSGSPILNEKQEVIGIIKTSTMAFTDIAPNGINTNGGAVSIGRATQNFLQELGQWKLHGQSQGNLDELHSLHDDLIIDEWSKYMSFFLSAKQLPTVLMEKSAEELADQLHQRCEALTNKLQKGFLTAMEREQESLDDCLNIEAFIQCPSNPVSDLNGTDTTENGPEPRLWEHTFCPSSEKQKSYSQTLLHLFDVGYQHDMSFSRLILAQAATLNPELSFDKIFNEKLSQFQPTLTFTIANQILSTQLAEGDVRPQYQGQDIVDLFVNYNKHPHYMYFVKEIVSGLIIINNFKLSNVRFGNIVNGLIEDHEVSLSDKFWLETVAYHNNFY